MSSIFGSAYSGFKDLCSDPTCNTSLLVADIGIRLMSLAKELYQSSEIIGKATEGIIAVSKNKDPKRVYDRVSESVQEKLEGLVRLNKMDPTKIIFIIDKVGGASSVFNSFGSLSFHNRSVIFIPPVEYSRIEESESLPNDVQFVISHELGHIALDHIRTHQRNDQIQRIFFLAVYLLVTASLLRNNWSYLAASIIGIVIKYGFAATVGITVKNSQLRKNEFEADTFAARNSDIRQMGIEFFKNDLVVNLRTRQQIVDRDTSNSALESLILRYIIGVDDQGNNFKDKTHPPLTDRIAMLENTN